MTTASQVQNFNDPIAANPHQRGAGQINPSKALEPGLIYDAGPADYERYVCAATDPKAYSTSWLVENDYEAPKRPLFCSTSLCRGGQCSYPQALRDFNTPSFSMPGLSPAAAGVAKRTVTYLAAGPAVFTATLQLPSGYTGKWDIDPKANRRGQVSRTQLQFAKKGEKRQFTLSITAGADAPVGTWVYGNLTWKDEGGRYVVYSPIAVQRAGPAR